VADNLDLRVLVTGASSGIGAAFARAFRARGERVVLVARRADRLNALASELGGEPHALPWPADLAGEGAAEALRSGLAARGIAVDTLVNCAGLGHTAPFEAQPPETIRAMLDVNVRAVVELTRAFLPGMRARGRGRVVNVASNAAFQPVPHLAVYAASKAFVLSFTEALADEVRGTGIGVQALCPGITATEFLDVAQTHRGLLVTRMPMLSADEVVRASLAGLDRGRVRVVAGWSNRLLGFLVQRLAPRGLARRVAGELYRPRGTAAEMRQPPDMIADPPRRTTDPCSPRGGNQGR
jgi:short-subunit dehydrogenase